MMPARGLKPLSRSGRELGAGGSIGGACKAVSLISLSPRMAKSGTGQRENQPDFHEHQATDRRRKRRHTVCSRAAGRQGRDIYLRGVDGGELVQPTVGQLEAKPRSSNMQATTDSPL